MKCEVRLRLSSPRLCRLPFRPYFLSLRMSGSSRTLVEKAVFSPRNCFCTSAQEVGWVLCGSVSVAFLFKASSTHNVGHKLKTQGQELYVPLTLPGRRLWVFIYSRDLCVPLTKTTQSSSRWL